MAASNDDFDDEGQELPDTTFGARYISKAYKAYRQYAGNRPLQLKDHIPTTQIVWETYFELDWNFDNSLQTILNSPTPPTLATLKSLTEFSSEDEHAFSVYLLILEKEKHQVDRDDEEEDGEEEDGEEEDGEDEDSGDEDLPLIYIGSGIKRTTGTHERFEDYDNGEGFSSLTTLAHQHGYQITHKKILISAPCPSTTLSMLSARALFLVLETASMYELHAYADRVPSHATLTNNKWNGSSVPYKGLCTHGAWREGVRASRWLTAGLSQEEIDEAKRQRMAEYHRERYTNIKAAETPEEAEERKRKDREQKVNKRAVETLEEAEERKRKVRERYTNKKAVETPEEAEERKRKVREQYSNKKAAETLEEAEERNRKERERYANKKATETPEEAEEYKRKTLEEAEERKRKNRERMANMRATETPEEAEERKRKAHEQYANKKATKTPEQREEQKRKDRERMANKKVTETPEEAEERKRKNREYLANMRATETLEEAEERKRKDREYLANKKATETPEQREERKRKDRERMANQRAAKRIKTD